MNRLRIGSTLAFVAALGVSAATQTGPFSAPLSMTPVPVMEDQELQWDTPIAYVRSPRNQTTGDSIFAEVGQPRKMQPNSDLVLWRPNGTEEVLVDVPSPQAIVDPSVTHDGQWIMYALMYDGLNPKGSDIYKVHVQTKEIVRLTHQEFTPNHAKIPVPPWKIHNLGPYELSGGRFVFVSDRNGYEAVNPGYAQNSLALQLYTADLNDGSNVELIGEMNLGSALHPFPLTDGRIAFSHLESQGLRSHHLWSLMAIHPDGASWSPLFSGFEIGGPTSESQHFQTQSSDGRIWLQGYYNLNNDSLGYLLSFPLTVPDQFPPDGPQHAFGPAATNDPRNAALRFGRHPDGRGQYYRFPFSPFDLRSETPHVVKSDNPAQTSIITDPSSPRTGKYGHPSAAPDNSILTAWSPGSVNNKTAYTPLFDTGIYVIKHGKTVNQPGDLRLVVNSPLYNEQWPRAVVPYQRIYGIPAPAMVPRHPNAGTLHAALPKGAPFGMVGTSSLYKRESFPRGNVQPGDVTATSSTGDPVMDLLREWHWRVQGADAGLYANKEIAAIRIVHLEPTSETGKRRFYNHPKEKMSILAEIPVRKFDAQGKQSTFDPDGNPDTSFLVRIPANVSWKLQTLDKDGLVLNDSQAWHQLKPGEIRTDCGGCHAHSQERTDFKGTAAGRGEVWFDATSQVPLLTSRDRDESEKQWTTENDLGLRFVKSSDSARPKVTVEYYRDIRPILNKSCVPCHTSDNGKTPDAGLDLSSDELVRGYNAQGLGGYMDNLPKSYAILAADQTGAVSGKTRWVRDWRQQLGASRYITMMQSRRSFIMWKMFGRRLDGIDNEALIYQPDPLNNPTHWRWKGQDVTPTAYQLDTFTHLGYYGEIMPPPESVASGLVQPLTDEDKRTFARWIDLGAPIDRSSDQQSGWLLDDQRPVLIVTEPTAYRNASVSRVVVGAYDLGSGLDWSTMTLTFSVGVDDVSANANAAAKLKPVSPGVWEWTFAAPMPATSNVTLIAAVTDVQGNTTKIERRFSVDNGQPPPPPPPAFTRLGCMGTVTDLRYEIVKDDATLSLQEAADVARASGFRYFGLLDGDTVRADYTLTRAGAPEVRPEWECNVPLNADPEILSGVADIRMSLYEFQNWTMPDNPTPPPQPPNPCALCPCPTCPTLPTTSNIRRVGAFVEKSPRVWKEVLCTPDTPVCRTLEHRRVLTIELAEYIARMLGAKKFALQNGYVLYISRDDNIDYDKYGVYTGNLKPCDGNVYSDTPSTCGANMVNEVYDVLPLQ